MEDILACTGSRGREGVDKRIDVLAGAIRSGNTIYDLEELELACLLSSAKDPAKMARWLYGRE